MKNQKPNRTQTRITIEKKYEFMDFVGVESGLIWRGLFIGPYRRYTSVYARIELSCILKSQLALSSG